MFPAARGVLTAVLCVQLTGCYSWVEIRPTEAPKLNGSYSRVTGSVSTPSGTVTTVERTVAHVERPDGTVVEITGDFDLRVTKANGMTAEFAHPVSAELLEDGFLFRGGNHPATEFSLSDVKQVEVSQFDAEATIGFSVAFAIALGVATVILIAPGSD